MTDNERVTLKDLYALQERMDVKIDRMADKISSHYVNRNELEARFKPIEDDLNRFKNLVYGTIATLIGLIVAAIAGGNIL